MKGNNINGGGIPNIGPKGAPKITAKKLVFSCSALMKHVYFEGNFTRLEADLRKGVSAVNGSINAGDILKTRFKRDILNFKVVKVSPDKVELELDSVDHTARWIFHARPMATLVKTYSKRCSEKKIELEIQPFKMKWMPMEMDFISLAATVCTAITVGNPFSLRVMKTEEDNEWSEGHTVLSGILTSSDVKVKEADWRKRNEEKQEILLSVLETIRVEEDRDIRINLEGKVQKQFGKVFFMPDYSGVVPGEKLSEVNHRSSTLTAADAAKTNGCAGKLVVWENYKDTSILQKQGIQNVETAALDKVFKIVLEHYGKLKDMQKDAMTKAEVGKFLDILPVFQRKIMGGIEAKKSVLVSELQGLIDILRQAMPPRNKEDVDMMTNYIVKTLLVKGREWTVDDLENKLPFEDKPIILIARSLTAYEAAEAVKMNVNVILVSQMVPNSHPELLLKTRGFNRLIRVDEEIAEMIEDPEGSCKGRNPGALVVPIGKTVELYFDVPEPIYQFLLSTEIIDEVKQEQSLMTVGFPRKLGRKNVRIKVNAGPVEDTHVGFRLFLPNGIGLSRMEWLYKQNGGLLPAEELAEEILKYCKISRAHYGGKTSKPLPARFRFLDMGDRRDAKNDINGIENKENLSGAEFNLSKEGEPILRVEMDAALRAHDRLEEDQLEVMLAYVKRIEQFERAKEIFQEVKGQVWEEMYPVPGSAPKGSSIDTDFRIPFGVMIETKEAALNYEPFVTEADFISLGLNDLKYAFRMDTIVNPEMVKILAGIEDKCGKTSTPLSTCGNINGRKELLTLLLLGILDISVEMTDVPEVAKVVRSLDMLGSDFLKESKEKLMEAKTEQELNIILGDVEKQMGETMRADLAQMAKKAQLVNQRDIRDRNRKIHDTKFRVLAMISKISKDDTKDKAKQVLDLLKKSFSKEETPLIKYPSEEEAARWLNDISLAYSFLDELEMSEVHDRKLRCTPLRFLFEPKDNSFWATAQSRGGVTGTLSRLFVKVKSVKGGQEGKQDLLIADINYFNLDDKEVRQTACILNPVEGTTDRFTATIPLNSSENGPKEVVELLAREEKGNKVFYRKLTGERLFIANLLNGNISVPPHSSIRRFDYEKMTAVYISSRHRFSNLDSVKPFDVAGELKKYQDNVYYGSNFDNVNQVLYYKTGEEEDNGCKIFNMTMVDNWRQNHEEGFMSIVSDPTDLVEIIQYLGAEEIEETFIRSHMEENDRLRLQMEEIKKKQLKDDTKESLIKAWKMMNSIT